MVVRRPLVTIAGEQQELPAADTLPGLAFCVLTADYTLTSSITAQKLFNASANGALTLAVGRYEYSMMAYISLMSATSGNGLVTLLGGGTATIAQHMYLINGVDAVGALNAAARTGSGGAPAGSGPTAVTAGVGTQMLFEMNGTFNVTAAGTIIPSITLATAAAAVVNQGSFIRLGLLSPTGANVQGAWS